MNARINMPREAIAAFCKKWRIAEFSLFGSVLRDDFKPDSDVDVLVVFEDDAHWGFEQFQEMTKELEAICRRKVDLVEKRLIVQSENDIRRKHILNNLENIYVAR